MSAQSLGLLGRGAPNLLSPVCILLVIPLFMSYPMGLVLALPSLVFLAMGCHLFVGSRTVPVRTWILLWVLVALSCVLYVGGFRYGLQYQGTFHTWFCLLASICILSTTVFVLRLSRRQPSFLLNVLGHWLVFAWAVTYAFPYLGELP